MDKAFNNFKIENLKTHNLGYPRIGQQREYKKALEQYWTGKIDQLALQQVGQQLRQQNWQKQMDAGFDFIPVGDFAWYDHVLNQSALLGVVPTRFAQADESIDLDCIFRMARGKAPTGQSTRACELTKWFDANYHYLVPELEKNQTFSIRYEALFDEINEAQALGAKVKPVLLGPLTFLALSKCVAEEFNKLDLLPKLIQAYIEIFKRLEALNIEWLQFDEPILATDLDYDWQVAFEKTYSTLAEKTNLKFLLATYFAGVEDNYSLIQNLSIDGLHLDCVRGQDSWQKIAQQWPEELVLSLGVIDGRNIWKADVSKIAHELAACLSARQGAVWLAPSCSLLHVPVCLEQEQNLHTDIKTWLAFAEEKLQEVNVLASLLRQDSSANRKQFVAHFVDNSDEVATKRKCSPLTYKANVQYKLDNLNQSLFNRKSSFAERQIKQKSCLHLPLLPTTTIGSFPQTDEIRQARKQFKQGEIDQQQYQLAMQQEIKHVIQQQEQLGLDVLVHGEAERNDMVEYFGELLDGVITTELGWVQSYGSRCVKPPIIYGDVERTQDMTVAWSSFAQQQTEKYVKGMLTGPVTILTWSFVRNDQAREKTAKQIALAIRDEVAALEQAGIKIIQIDEAAFREGLPLQQKNKADYLRWAVEAFRLASTVVADTTQIHTHMCYSEFHDILPAIQALDADVITIECSRSNMELLNDLQQFDYANEIGPGVYDIHSPNVPEQLDIEKLLDKALTILPVERLWVNPDCGLKTRGWQEVSEALQNMVTATEQVRKSLQAKQKIA